MNNRKPRKPKPKRGTPPKSTKAQRVKKETQILVSKIKALYHLSITTGVESMKHFIAVGEAALELKKKAGHGKFIKTLKIELPHIDIRQIQRSMNLSKAYDFFKFEALYLAPREHLERIIKIAGDTPVLAFLEESGIELELDHDQKEEVHVFLEAIKNLANQASKSTKKISEKSEKDEDGSTDSEPESPDNTQMYTTKGIYDWIKHQHKGCSEKGRVLSVNQTKNLNRLIKALNKLVDDFGQEQEGDNDE